MMAPNVLRPTRLSKRRKLISLIGENLRRLRGYRISDRRSGERALRMAQPTLFITVRDETAKTPRETGTRRREEGRHT